MWRSVVVLLFLLVLAAAWLVRRARRPSEGPRGGPGDEAARGASEGAAERRVSFPYRRPCLPPPNAM